MIASKLEFSYISLIWILQFAIIEKRSGGMGATEYNLPQRVLEDITVFAQKYNVDKIILFGSRAKGTHRERSDIDIAVLGGDFDGFYWDIKENAWTLLMFD